MKREVDEFNELVMNLMGLCQNPNAGFPTDKDGRFIIEIPGFNNEMISASVDADNILNIEGKNEELDISFKKAYKLKPTVENVEITVKDGLMFIKCQEKESEIEIKIS